MTADGILARGKANYDSNKFLDNIETLAYISTLTKEKASSEAPKPVKIDASKEVKDDKPNRRTVSA